jgi:hypothetical protein
MWGDKRYCRKGKKTFEHNWYRRRVRQMQCCQSHPYRFAGSWPAIGSDVYNINISLERLKQLQKSWCSPFMYREHNICQLLNFHLSFTRVESGYVSGSA